jgi:hypothetical protein
MSRSSSSPPHLLGSGTEHSALVNFDDFSSLRESRGPRGQEPEALTSGSRIQTLATENPSYGYRLVTALLKREVWAVNPKCVYRLWRQSWLSHRPKAQKRRRLGSSANSCVLLKPAYPGQAPQVLLGAMTSSSFRPKTAGG